MAGIEESSDILPESSDAEYSAHMAGGSIKQSEWQSREWVLLTPPQVAHRQPNLALLATHPAPDFGESASDAWRSSVVDGAAAPADSNDAAAAVEELQYQLLEAQAGHARELARMRSALQQKDALISSLQQQIAQYASSNGGGRGVPSTSIAAVVAREEELSRLRDTVQLLQLQLAQASEDKQAARAAAASGKQEATIAALRGDLAAAAAARSDAEAAAAAARADAAAASQALSQRDSELAAIRSHITEQQGRIRALHEQLSGFLQRDASDAARADAAEAEVSQLRLLLLRREEQLTKVTEALQRVRQREATSGAALEAHSTGLAHLQQALLAATAEADRWRRAVDVLQNQHASLVDSFEEQREQLEALQAEREREADAITKTLTAVDTITQLSQALAAAKSEADAAAEALAAAAEGHAREVAALHHKLLEQQTVIAGLQADLAAAASSNTSGDMAAAVQQQQVAAAAPSASSPSSSSSSFSALQLQCESLSRKLQTQNQRVRELEEQQEVLLGLNERLRTALTAAQAELHQATAAAAPTAAAVQSQSRQPESTSIATAQVSQLISHVSSYTAAFDAAVELMHECVALDSLLRMHLDDESPTSSTSSSSSNKGMTEAVLSAAVQRLKMPLTAVLSGPAAASDAAVPLSERVVEPALAAQLLQRTAHTVAALRLHVSDKAASSLGGACAMQ